MGTHDRLRVVRAEFVRSGADPSVGAGWPASGPPEVAFLGRSNVGKSTLLGALMGQRGLVRTSSTPGRTRLINFFRVLVKAGGRPDPTELAFVDLPGFGYAKVSREERAAWRPFVEAYLERRPTLKACVLIVDARRVDDGELFDETELATWLTDRGLALVLVMTKSDKLAKHERRPAAERLRRRFAVAPVAVSATSGDGLDELWRRLVVALHLGAD
jgi:GTP-binding protein